MSLLRMLLEKKKKKKKSILIWSIWWVSCWYTSLKNDPDIPEEVSLKKKEKKEWQNVWGIK
jgi:hypothetical protein